MSYRCKIGLHAWIETKQEEETRKKDTGAAIETIKENFIHYKCKRCGKEKKEINECWKSSMDEMYKVKDREIINREWKNRQNDTE